jgi:transposase InsO family protein
MLAQEYPVSLICQLLDCPRSSYYYPTQQPDERTLKTVIETVAADWPTYGYRRVTVQIRRDYQLMVNHKRVSRLMADLGLSVKKKSAKRRTTNSQHPYPRYPNLVEGLEIVRPDQIWVSDITYIRLRSDWVYLAVIMDVFTRAIRGWHLGRHLDQELTLTALRRALQTHTPEIHHSDQGLQYAATAYTDLLTSVKAQISMAEVGQAWQNGYAERLMRTLKEEEVDLSDYEDYAEAYRHIGRFLDQVYMHKRIHSALGYLTPAEFESQWLKEQVHSRSMN